MDNMRLAAEIEERQRYSALQMKESSKETGTPRPNSDSVAKTAAEMSDKSRKL